MLLIDQATEAITEAVHRLRAGSVLDDCDLAAAGVALNDLASLASPEVRISPASCCCGTQLLGKSHDARPLG